MTEPHRRLGTKFIAKLETDDSVMVLPDGSIAIANPNRPVRVIRAGATDAMATPPDLLDSGPCPWRFAAVPVVLNPTLPPGTIELRGANRVRLVNLAPQNTEPSEKA